MVAMVLSARSLPTALALVVHRRGAPDAELSLGRPQKIVNGLWRVEAGIPASTFTVKSS